MRFNAGHALNYFSVQPVAALPGVRELHIGHAIVSRSLFVGLREAFKRRQQQAHFADAFTIPQQLGQRALGPAAARQFGVQVGEARGNCVKGCCQLLATPYQGMVQQFGKRGFHGDGQSALPWRRQGGLDQTGTDSLSNDRSIVNCVAPRHAK